MTAAEPTAAGGPLSDWDHPTWRWREQIHGAAAREISEQMVGAVESLLPLGDDAMRAGMTMLCQVWRAQQRLPATVDATRAQSAAELIGQFIADLETWAMRPDEPTGCLGVLCGPDLRRFAAHWLPAGELPPPADAAAAAVLEDAQSATTRAAIAHIDALTARREDPA